MEVSGNSLLSIVSSSTYKSGSLSAMIYLFKFCSIGLPTYFGYVDSRYRVPVRAVALVSVLVALLSLLNIGSGTYVAFSAITSLSSMSMYLSYAIVLACVLWSRVTRDIELGQWNFGKKAGIMVNVAGLVYTVYATIWLPFPNYLPVTAANMKYSGPVLGAVLVFAVSLWFVRARAEWSGPNRAIADFVLRSES